MSHVTFIYPCVGRFPETEYVRSWKMQPLVIAQLAGMTPSSWDTTFFDDRLEEIDYTQKTDFVALSIETYTARRGYQIAAQYRRRGVPVIMGGYHATFCPDEVLEHAEAVCIGEAESVWSQILDDGQEGCLRGVYTSKQRPSLEGFSPDRSVFDGKDYFKLALIEAGRGCTFNCRFCSITSFFGGTSRRRPVDDIVAEIESIGEKNIFFVDDNIIGNVAQAKELFGALASLDINWFSQASINVADDEALLTAMARSGCLGLLIGLESLDEKTLAGYGKKVNARSDYAVALERIRKHGLLVYGTFMFGAPGETPDTADRTVAFAREQKMFLAAFAHTVPFPGTPLYRDCERDGKLLYDKWWMSETYRFGQAPYEPAGMTPDDLELLCHRARKRFYAASSICARAIEWNANCKNLRNTKLYVSANILLRAEVHQKRGLPLGLQGQE